eukprot:4165184-Amphidinium_carterae.1
MNSHLVSFVVRGVFNQHGNGTGWFELPELGVKHVRGDFGPYSWLNSMPWQYIPNGLVPPQALCH